MRGIVYEGENYFITDSGGFGGRYIFGTSGVQGTEVAKAPAGATAVFTFPLGNNTAASMLYKKFTVVGVSSGALKDLSNDMYILCTDLLQLKEMKKKSQYVFLKNIFDCIEFKDEKSSFSLNQLELAAKEGLIDKKVYALGGMSLENVKIAKALGFGGIVICGDLWNRFDIHNERDYKEVINHFEKLRKAVN